MVQGAMDPRVKRGATLLALGLAVAIGAVSWGVTFGVSALNARLHAAGLPGETELYLPKLAYCIIFHEWPRANGALAPVNPLASTQCPSPCPLFKVDFAVTNVETNEIVSVMEAGGAGEVRYAVGKRSGHGLAGFVVPEEGRYRIVTKYREDAGEMPPLALTIGEDFEPEYSRVRSIAWGILGAGVAMIVAGGAFCLFGQRSRVPVAGYYNRGN